MNKVRFFLCALGTLIIQTTVVSKISILNATPNLTLVFIIALSILYGEKLGAYTGLVMGLIEDVIFAQVLGVRALIYYVIGYIIGRSVQNNASYLPTGILITLLSTISGTLMHWFIQFLLGSSLTNLWYVKGPLFVEAAMNAGLYVLVLQILKKILKPDTVRKFTGY